MLLTEMLTAMDGDTSSLLLYDILSFTFLRSPLWTVIYPPAPTAVDCDRHMFSPPWIMLYKSTQTHMDCDSHTCANRHWYPPWTLFHYSVRASNRADLSNNTAKFISAKNNLSSSSSGLHKVSNKKHCKTLLFLKRSVMSSVIGVEEKRSQVDLLSKHSIILSV